ncbi:hypothetical protein JTE90_028584 [Oedothorax gibbosus]|uniref:Nuclease HARBI1 n=1 Tax=Oedothorax gibbosus TaxID=931172 RepID=A0AAV6TX51_9ARAC|nr:hypothetical protein JTE90_028584 [Oedothorax gibbosus]
MYKLNQAAAECCFGETICVPHNIQLVTRKKMHCAQVVYVKRKQLGCFDNLVRELAFEDPNGYRRYLRMDTDTFEVLLGYVSSRIGKRDTVLRKAIPAAARLALTLRFLATGETQTSLHFQFRMGISTICGILMEVCTAIFSTMRADVIPTPSTEEEWREISTNRFRLFQTTIYGTPAKVKAYVLAACCLHNFLRMRILEREGMDAIQGEQLMTETENSEWQQRAIAFVPLQRGNWRGNQQAKLVRHKFTEFFNSTGAVEFQERQCNLH